MPNKTRNWTDVELIMSSVSIALTLGFWGLFASRQKTGASVLGQVSLVSGSDTPAAAATSVPATLLPGQTIFFGGSATTPQPPPLVASQPQPRRRGGGGGGGGSAASTGSSRP